MKFYIRGGIGDLLQYYKFINNNLDKEYLVHMHFKNAKQIFDEIGALSCSFYEFEDIESLNKQTDAIVNRVHNIDKENIYDTPRAFYSEFNFGYDANKSAEDLVNSFPVKKDIIGIHPFRSGFALSVYDSFNLSAKIIPIDLINKIITSNYNYVIFGSEKELTNYGLQESDNVKFASFKNILHSLSAVKHCKTLIGLDSCFKSMSSMQRINTICIIMDFEDPVRDAYFIKKYEEDKIMKIFKTKNIVVDKDKIIKFIKSNI